MADKQIDLRVKLGKLELTTPIVCASGTFGFGEELRGLVNFRNIGAVTTKTITLNPCPGNPPPRIYETECGVINSIGLENPGWEVFVKEKLPQLKKLPTQFIVSIGGFCSEEYIEILKRLKEIKEIKTVEINLSCPNIKNKQIISQSKRLTYQLVKSLRGLTTQTLIAKITPEVTDIVEIAKAVKSAGADVLSLVNTFFALAINIETQRPYIGSGYGGYSGKAIKPMSLYRVWRVCQEVDIPVIGGGGIDDAKDAIEFILAGASAISLGTVNLASPNIAENILKGIKEYMKRKGIRDIKELRGSMSI